jgi:hypothetical protein
MKRLHNDLRSQLSLRLDGNPVESSQTVRQVHATVLSEFEPQFSRVLAWLRQMPTGELVALQSHCDAVSTVFDLAGARPVFVTERPSVQLNPRVIIAGCGRQHFQKLAIDPVGFMRSGGVLVTSDHTLASVHLPAGLILREPPAAPGRARLPYLETASGLAPAVALAAGHIPVSVDNASGTNVHVLATDILTGKPVVLVVRVGEGWLLHSVAHWYQHCPVPATAVERRPVNLTGYHMDCPELPEDASVGLVLAARSMLVLLLSALQMVLDNSRN